MNITLQHRIDLMTKLGEYLSSGDKELAEIKNQASLHNGWFIPEFVDLALKNIAEEFLQKEKLEKWVEKYHGLAEKGHEKNVGIIMAGNIPAVGFHDFLSVFMAGQNMSVKLSSKDTVLIKHFIEKIKLWEPKLYENIQIKEMLKGCDAYIATGSNNSARYFQYYFQKYPHIIRRNRTSVAILDGTESKEELAQLSDDIFLYFGLGCRNVTKLYVPEEYDFGLLMDIFKRYDFLKNFHRYGNNYDYNLSIALLNKTKFMTNDVALFLEQASPFSPISVLHYENYKNKKEVESQVAGNESIQCIVGHHHLPFGQVQHPALDDYADGFDTMKFLTEIND
ncbi:MAG: acyl-CoA reductase [Chitinophagaceae bacterium]